jgi:hypothetical protein
MATGLIVSCCSGLARMLFPSWPGLSRPPTLHRRRAGGRDQPGHDDLGPCRFARILFYAMKQTSSFHTVWKARHDEACAFNGTFVETIAQLLAPGADLLDQDKD